jgi:hypothetical protein
VKKKELEAKTVAELRALAGRLGITLGVRLKADIIERIIGESRKRARKRPGAARKKGARALPGAKRPAARAVKKTVKAGKPPRPAKEEAPLTRTGPGVPHPKALIPFLEKERRQPSAPPAETGAPEEEKKTRAEAPKGDVRPPGETDWVSAIAVEPSRIFICWGITESTARKGAVVLRVHDVTGREYMVEKALYFFDVPLAWRHGSAEVGVDPGREYMVEAGVTGPGGVFVPVLRATRVVTPPSGPLEGESVLPERYFRYYPGYGS